MSKVSIPKELFDPFFFSEEQIEISIKTSKLFDVTIPFYHEIAYYSGIPSVKPWEVAEEVIPELMKSWKELQIEINNLFERRDNRETLVPMKRGIAYLIEFVFWTNGLPAQKIPGFDFTSLQLKPVNFLERLSFLLKRPNIYPSFVQLIELMEEQQKQFSKYIAIMKAKN
ncbi:MAG: hypothetical protein K0S25_447 [Bacillus sp. (in: firmicutes)]|jgi:hypothetical protein|nr:hypothetical protein [Bacillus sp. (in: firmicutes)]